MHFGYELPGSTIDHNDRGNLEEHKYIYCGHVSILIGYHDTQLEPKLHFEQLNVHGVQKGRKARLNSKRENGTLNHLEVVKENWLFQI